MTQKVLFEKSNLRDKINVHSANELLSWRGEHANNLLHLLVNKKETALLKKLEKVLSASQLQILLLQRNELGDTPLHLAVWTGQTDFVHSFSHYLENFDIQDLKKRTPLMLAIKNNNKNLIKVLLNKTHNINAQDSSGKTALHYCSEYADKTIYEQIINVGADNTITDFSNIVAQCPIKNINTSYLHQTSVEDILKITKKQRF